MALQNYLFILGAIGLLVLASLRTLVENVLDYEIIILGLSFFSPFAFSLGACIKKDVSLCQSSPWAIFLILSSMLLTAPLLSLLYPTEEFLGLKFCSFLAPFLLIGWYYLLSNKPNSILLQFKVRPAILYALVFSICILLLINFGVKFIKQAIQKGQITVGS